MALSTMPCRPCNTQPHTTLLLLPVLHRPPGRRLGCGIWHCISERRAPRGFGGCPPGTQKLLSVSVARDSTHPTRSPSLFFGRTEPGWAASPPPIRWQARQRGRRGGGFGAWRPFSNNARLFSKRPSRIFDDAPHLGRWKGYRGRNGGLSEGARRCIQAA